VQAQRQHGTAAHNMAQHASSAYYCKRLSLQQYGNAVHVGNKAAGVVGRAAEEVEWRACCGTQLLEAGSTVRAVQFATLAVLICHAGSMLVCHAGQAASPAGPVSRGEVDEQGPPPWGGVGVLTVAAQQAGRQAGRQAEPNGAVEG